MIKDWIERFKKEQKLKELDEVSRLMGCNSYSLFPPSYKERMSEEEYNKLVADEIVVLRELLEEMPDEV